MRSPESAQVSASRHQDAVDVVRLTARGKRAFDVMAAEHEDWVIALFAGLSGSERSRLHALLGRLKTTLHAADGAQPGKEARQ